MKRWLEVVLLLAACVAGGCSADVVRVDGSGGSGSTGGA